MDLFSLFLDVLAAMFGRGESLPKTSSPAYYRHSGAIDPLSLPVLLLVCTGASAILGAVYAHVIHYDPIIYLNLLETPLFGLGLGWAVFGAVFLGKVRNTRVVAVAAVCTSLLGNYLAWVVTLYIWTGREMVWILPADVLSIAWMAAEEGRWSAFGITPTGWFLCLLWIAEQAIISYLTYLVPVSRHRTLAFCEKSKSWATRSEEFGPFAAITDYDKVRAMVEAGDFSPLLDLRRVAFKGAFYSRAVLHSSRRNPDFVTISLHNIEEHPERHAGAKDVSVVFQHLLSAPATHALLRKYWSEAPLTTRRYAPAKHSR